MQTAVPTKRMNLADLLDAAGRLYLDNAVLFIGTIGVVAIIQAVLRLAAGATAGSSLSGLLGIVGTGALIQAISARHLGREITIAEVYSSIGVGTFVTLIVASILFFIVVGIGFILLIIPGIYLLVRFLFVPQAVIVERAGILQAFSRSGDLVRGSWFRVFGYGFVLLLLVTVVEAAAQSLPGVGSVLSFIIEALIEPFSVGVLTLLYFDLRAEKEGSFPGQAI